MTGKCKQCNKEFKYYPSCSTGKYCSTKCSFLSPEWRKNQSLTKLGRRHSLESRQKMSKSRKGIKMNPDWIKKRFASFKQFYDKKGRSSELTKKITSSSRYSDWRGVIKFRDEYKCTRCGSDKELHVHHIIPLSFLCVEAKLISSDEGIWDFENGITLCKECHKKTDTYASKRHLGSENRLLEAIKEEWKQEGEKGDFETFYREKVEKLIEMIKAKLD